MKIEKLSEYIKKHFRFKIEFARLEGVSKQQIHQWEKISIVKDGELFFEKKVKFVIYENKLYVFHKKLKQPERKK